MHRFFLPQEQISDDRFRIVGSDVNHIKNVLRLKAGEKIELFDSAQNIYQCEISEIKFDSVLGKIISKEKGSVESELEVTLAQSLPKGKKMDLIVKMATELGVKKIVPVLSERSVPKIEEKEEKKIAHWQTTAKEAAEQSGRSLIPRIAPLTNLSRLNSNAYDLALMPWEGEETHSLKSILKGAAPKKIIVLIGPEGGFSQAEAEQAKANGFKLVSIGKRILRCETAAVAALAQVFYELE
jgi:16S rRNA (uracil1498-N3)-methyltransferase